MIQCIKKRPARRSRRPTKRVGAGSLGHKIPAESVAAEARIRRVLSEEGQRVPPTGRNRLPDRD